MSDDKMIIEETPREPRAYVKNAADEKQVKEAALKARFDNKAEIDDMIFILSTQQGRRFLWRLLTYCKVFESIWHPSALIHHNSGKQDTGHFIMSEIINADEEAFIKMMTENKRK